MQSVVFKLQVVFIKCIFECSYILKLMSKALIQGDVV